MPQAAPQPAAQNTVAGQPGAGAAEAAAGPISIPWAPSLGPSVPVADITKSIADFLFIHVISRPDSNSLASTGIDIEIEAKLGLLIEKDTNQRVRLPVRSECVLDMPGRVRFENGLDVVANEQRQAGEAVFRELNTVLNSWVEDSNKPVQDGRVPITYVHRREVDSFHLLDSSALRSFHPSMQSLLDTPQTRNRGIKVRVSRDQKTGREIARIVKARVADLDLWMPNSPLDVRLSVNLEMRFEGDLPMDFGVAPNEDDGGERRKDRLGYRQSGYTVDLTQVTNSVSPSHLIHSTSSILRGGKRSTG